MDSWVWGSFTKAAKIACSVKVGENIFPKSLFGFIFRPCSSKRLWQIELGGSQMKQPEIWIWIIDQWVREGHYSKKKSHPFYKSIQSSVQCCFISIQMTARYNNWRRFTSSVLFSPFSSCCNFTSKLHKWEMCSLLICSYFCLHESVTLNKNTVFAFIR